jgi:hypothetical protein
MLNICWAAPHDLGAVFQPVVSQLSITGYTSDHPYYAVAKPHATLVLVVREPLVVAARVPIATCSDSSDPLSLPLLGSPQAQEAAPDGTYFLTDVIVSTAPTWLGLFEDPMAANTSHRANDEVHALLECWCASAPSCALAHWVHCGLTGWWDARDGTVASRTRLRRSRGTICHAAVRPPPRSLSADSASAVPPIRG